MTNIDVQQEPSLPLISGAKEHNRLIGVGYLYRSVAVQFWLLTTVATS